MKKLIVTGALLVLVVLGGVFWIWHRHDGSVNSNQLTLYGNVDIRQVQLAFNSAERIASMDVLEGSTVKKGQPLATLDTRRLRPDVALAQAQVDTQQQVLRALKAGTRPQEVRKAQADVEAARIDAANAARNSRRLKVLATRKLASSEQADSAKAAADAAQAHLKAAREALALAVAGPREEDIAGAKATLQGFEARLVLAQQNLANATLYAPTDGVIEDRILEPGDMASPQVPVYTLALTNPVWVRAYVSERDLGKIHPGQPAEIATDSFPNKRYRAWIGYISPTAEFTPKSVETKEVRSNLVYQIRVYACNPAGELRLGMPATVLISLHAKNSAGGPKPCNTAH